MKILISLSILFYSILYADDTYTCYMKTLTASNGKTKDVSKKKPGKMVIKTEWYGKPSYMIVYDADGITVGKMCENTQTKSEWISSDKLLFINKSQNRTYEMILDKGATPNLIVKETRGSMYVTGIGKCFKK